MITEILIRYVHFLGILVLVSSVVGEFLLLKDEMSRAGIRRLAVLDAFYGVSSIIVVAAGLTLWFGVGKPADFYSHNWILHTKIGLVILLGLFSIYPTVFFIRNRKGEPEELLPIPGTIKLLIRLELLLLVLIPLCATLMAKGVGLEIAD